MIRLDGSSNVSTGMVTTRAIVQARLASDRSVPAAVPGTPAEPDGAGEKGVPVGSGVDCAARRPQVSQNPVSSTVPAQLG
jgi:hypothetical protein